ncbi:L-serine ammonia-lyase, iron-sulfur-dependent subunit beta [Tissierella praeacuta]|uniref:L-serine deaminase n=1 Tax=Tissierella praeacuta DSM 18095 TaxID=1123404 RepID=A0A1M4V2M6_9FIRM|nr:L-serine ammonia-lyase, iron-sulfur-dependent subunit beta [Tissierella praeacuta]HAE91904.1 L-serine ammonia-lyase, iron-sulfur-dependent, subunit beta [Tissierella sp.]MBU5255108.1 L-serine ammonia-lyase, iron-sulfur-dependent subunit beta [Tissierella praeacuta]TCU74042.1 L-serine dehydratase [Tissierella praeacuta]SHE63138.1 L-serine dehydratase [Tissierella praeacuta DSM 18095]SUP02829.1 L-serine dehydratase, beta chain [Tissierella praeacuta]
MKDYGVFDILGPVMIGPSSSHTAGAARLGKIAKDIVGTEFHKVVFYLHGSFGKTFEGHGTDKALVAGILGMDPSDEKLRDSFEIAKSKNIEFEFIEADLGYQHPNTVKIVFKFENQEDIYIIGSSIGGGNILITDINGNKVEFSGDYPTMLIKYIDQKGAISRISSILSINEINIATMKVTRENDIATMVVETDSDINEKVVAEIEKLNEVIYIKGINPIKR